MLIDSHCHLNFNELAINLSEHLKLMQEAQVNYALCVATRPDNIDQVITLAENNPNLFATAGIHPDEELTDFSLNNDYLLNFVDHPKVIGLGETGLDYYHNQDTTHKSWQHKRFETHIQVAKITDLPLIVHTRKAAYDTWQMLKDNQISSCGAVIHCFTENLEWARKFLDIGCYISFSGITTFKNAPDIQEAAKFVPLDRMLVETDAPYLAPVPYRGKMNHPALVKYTAQFIADLRCINLEELALATTTNFFNLFPKAKRYILET